MKYYIIAGEPSGDIYGSRLIQEIIKTNPNSEIRFWGGDLMKKSGYQTHVYSELKNISFLTRQNMI